jgi:hypothetical protein
VGHKKILTLCIATALIVGCGAQKPKYSMQDVMSAQSNGSLEALYTKIKADMATGNAQENASKLLKDVGKRLAQQKSDQLMKRLSELRLDNGFIPLDQFATLEGQASQIEQWQPTRGSQVKNAISEEEGKTRAQIAQLQKEMQTLGKGQAVEQLNIGRQMAELAGTSSKTADVYTKTKDKVLQEQFNAGSEALLNEDYPLADQYFAFVSKIEPTYPELDQKLKQVKAGHFYVKFTQLLELGEAEKAYLSFIAISETDVFPAVKELIGPTTDIMSQYFNGLGHAATDEGNLETAYRLFQQSREILKRVDVGSPPVTAEEKNFMSKIYKLANKAFKSKDYGATLGFIKIIENLDKNYSNMHALNSRVKEKILERSMKGVATSVFTTNEGDEKHGAAIASRITQHLFEHVPNDVRIVERQKIKAVFDERKLDKSAGDKIASADYFIEGSILEAKVDYSVKEGTKTKRVVVGQKTVDNPEYAKWLATKKSERGNEPPKKTQVDVKEDVSISINNHRKVGVFSSSFRIIDANNAKVIYTDTLTETVQHTDESSQGLERGQFKHEHKFEDLPLDVEILEKLAVGLSAKIGAKLVEVLQNPEDKYLEQAQRFIKEGNIHQAVQYLADALVLTHRKDKPVEAIDSQLREYAMKTRFVRK